MAASLGLGSGRALLLEPRDEALDGEGLGAAVAGGGSGGGLSGGGGGGRGSRGGGSRGGGHGGSGGGRVAGARAGTRARAGARLVQSRAGDLVGGVVAAVDVVLDAGVGGGVQGGSQDTLRLVGTSAGDLDVEALGVVLGAVLGAGAVQGDGLVAEDVVSGGEAGRHGHGPGVVVGDHLVGGPAVGEASLVNLDPLEGALVGVGAVGSALGDVGQHGTDVAFGPLGPLEVDLAAGLDGGGGLGGLCVLVADDVGGGVGVRGNEAVVEVLGGPSGGVGGGLALLSLVVVGEVVTLGVDAVGDDAGDGAVGGGGGREGSESKEGRHVDVWWGTGKSRFGMNGVWK